MEKIPQHSTWLLPPTPRQTKAITTLCQQLGITETLEDKPSNRWEARRLIYRLRNKQKGEHNEKAPQPGRDRMV